MSSSITFLVYDAASSGIWNVPIYARPLTVNRTFYLESRVLNVAVPTGRRFFFVSGHFQGITVNPSAPGGTVQLNPLYLTYNTVQGGSVLFTIP